jgi:hypothetical protein
MSYWGSGIEDSDYAFTTIGATISWIKDRLMKGAETVVSREHPEQGVLALVCCLRLLGERFPKNLSVHFGSQDLEDVRSSFNRWAEVARAKVAPHLLEALRAAAEQEFRLFEERIFNKNANN